jgi:hypothetical protein
MRGTRMPLCLIPGRRWIRSSPTGREIGVDGFRSDMAHMEPPEFGNGLSLARANGCPLLSLLARLTITIQRRFREATRCCPGLNRGRGNVMFDLLDAGFDRCL